MLHLHELNKAETMFTYNNWPTNQSFI